MIAPSYRKHSISYVHVRKERFKKNNSNFENYFETFSYILQWLGITIHDNSYKETPACLTRLYHFSFRFITHIALLDVIVMYIMHASINKVTITEGLAYMFGNALTLSIWYSMYIKRSCVRILFHHLEQLSNGEAPNRNWIKTFLSILIMLVFLHPILVLIFLKTSKGNSEFCQFYYYHIFDECLFTVSGYVYIFLKTTLISFLCPLFNNVCSVLYCTLCYHCCILLKNYRRKVERIILNQSYSLLHPDFCNQYFKITAVVRKIQEVFSFVSFAVFSFNFISAFLLLSTFLKGENFPRLMIAEYVCSVIPCGILLILVPGYASQIVIEMRRNRAMFSQLYENMAFHPTVQATNLRVAEILMNALPISLSAWEMIDFNSNILPAVIGTLLTYGLLILNIGK